MPKFPQTCVVFCESAINRALDLNLFSPFGNLLDFFEKETIWRFRLACCRTVWSLITLCHTILKARNHVLLMHR